jgi:uncharacterized protein YdhG (YjbR/CyaY superfamily)
MKSTYLSKKKEHLRNIPQTNPQGIQLYNTQAYNRAYNCQDSIIKNPQQQELHSILCRYWYEIPLSSGDNITFHIKTELLNWMGYPNTR